MRGYTISSANVNTTNGRTSAMVTILLRFQSSAETHIVPMVTEDGTWKVCGRPY